MQEKALTIGKVLVSVPAVIFRAAARFAGSLVADIICLFMGPMRLYNNIKPTGFEWATFVLKAIVLEIYNIIALALNATLGLLYNLVESAFMMYELWTQKKVTVKELYRSGDKNEKEENKKEKEEQNSAKLVVKFLVGIIDIDNPMSKCIAGLCTKINDNKIFKAVSKKVVELINKLFVVTKQSKEKSEIGNIDNNNNNNLGTGSENNDMNKLNENDNNIEADKPYSLDSIFHPIHSFRAK